MAQIIFFLTSFLFFGVLQGKELHLESQVDHSLKPHFEFFHDVSGQLTFKDIKSESFSKTPLGGFFKGTVWTKARVCSHEPRTVHFIYKDPIEAVEVFTGKSSNKYSFLETKGLAPHFWVNLEVRLSSGCETLYVKFKSGDVMNFSARLMDEGSLKRAETNALLFYSVYYSFLLIIFLVALLFLFKFKKKVYFYFCSLLVAQDLLGASLLNGFIFRFVLGPENFVRYDLGNIFALLMNASLVAFALAFLKERLKVNTVLSKFFIASQALPLAMLLLNIVFEFYKQSPVLSQFVNQSILLSCFWVLYLAACSFDTKKGRLFLLASGFKVLGQFIKTLLLQGDVSEQLVFLSKDLSFFVFNIAAIGSLVEAFAITGILIASYFADIEEKNKKILEMAEEVSKAKVDSEVAKIARAVAHDLRSPLTTLDMLSSELSNEPEKRKVLIKDVVSRIRGVADNILETKDKVSPITENNLNFIEKETSQEILPILKQIVSEKRVQHQGKNGVELQFTNLLKKEHLFTQIESSQASRVLSNLIDNAFEAISKKGRVEVCLKRAEKNELAISIQDNGVGMSREVLSHIGEKGFSYGKEGFPNSGSGLGVFNAKTTIEKWGGRLEVSSLENVGSEFVIHLPLSNPPKSFVSQVEIPKSKRVVVIDDENSIHHAWSIKLASFEESSKEKLAVTYLSSPGELFNWICENETQGALFLVDYEFKGHKQTGLDLISELNLQGQSILVTGLDYNRDLRERCEDVGARYLSKARLCEVEVALMDNSAIQRKEVSTSNESVSMSF